MPSEESGWAVIDAAADDGQPVVLVGPLIHLEERERAHVIGTWVDDSRYGQQVKVSEARPLPPTDVESVTTYLRRVKHVGAKRAARLVELYGAARRARRDRRRPARGVCGRRDASGLDRRGDRVVGAAARDATAASAAGAARPRLPGAGGSRTPTATSRTASCPSARTSSPACSGSGSSPPTGSPAGSGVRATAPSGRVRPRCTSCRRPSAAAAPACRSTPCSPRSTSCSARRAWRPSSSTSSSRTAT